MKKYYKIDADLSLLLATPAPRQVAQVAQLVAGNQKKIGRYLTYYANKNIDELTRFINKCYQTYAKDPNTCTYLICSKSAKKIVGEIMLVYEPFQNDIAVTYFMDRHATHKGIMTKAISFLQEELILQEGIERLYAIIEKTNERSLLVMKHCGWTITNTDKDVQYCYQTEEGLKDYLRAQEQEVQTQHTPLHIYSGKKHHTRPKGKELYR